MRVLLFTLLLCQLPLPSSPPRMLPGFVFENAPRHYAIKDGGVIELTGGRGWLRVPRVFLDFRMTLEFRVLTDDTDAGVVIRTWTGKGGWPTSGYRVGLPRIGQPDPASVLIARKAESRLLISGLVEPRPTGEWQFLQINGEGRRVSVFLNRTRVGVFEVEHFGGHVLFEARKGAVQLRNVVVTPTDPIADLSAWRVPTPGTKAAQVLHEVKPRYTFEAMERRVTGVVEVEAVVLEDGTVGPARAIRTLDPDLDRCALAAVKAWRFQPAVRDGKPVATKVFIELTFVLQTIDR